MKSLTLPYQQGQIGVYQESYGSGVYRIVPEHRLYRIKLESAIISNLQRFLLELGKGFSM